MANTAPTQTVLTVNKSTLSDMYAGVEVTDPDFPDNVGCNAVWHTVVAGDNSAKMIFPTTGEEIILVQSTHTAKVTATVYANACDQGFTTEHNKVASLIAGNTTVQLKELGPFDPARWGASYGEGTLKVDNMVRFGLDIDTTTKVCIIQRPQSAY